MAEQQHFIDRRADMFGRSRFLDKLQEDVAGPGLTAIIGRPMSGKTWILKELGRGQEEAGALVGYYESGGDAPDILLRCISDLYTHWLQQASLKNELDTLVSRHKGRWSGIVGGVVSELATAVSGLQIPVWSKVADLVTQGLGTLVGVRDDHKSGGLALSTLDYDQARDLVGTLAEVSNRRILLILDAWEKAPNLETQKDLLDKYLHHPDEWPNAHIALGIRRERDDDAALHAIDALRHHLGVQMQTLGPLELEDGEQQRLFDHLRAKVPGVAELDSDHEILQLLGGYAGVLYRWLKVKPPDVEKLRQVARDAQAARYPELKDLLRKLTAQNGRVVARFTLLPEITSMVDWENCRNTVLADEPESIIADLQLNGILETPPVEYPSYGHSTRRDAACDWFTNDSQGRRFGQIEIEELLYAGRRRVRTVSSRRSEHVAFLAKTYDNAGNLHVSEDSDYAGRAAQSCIVRPDRFFDGFSESLSFWMSRMPELLLAEKIVETIDKNEDGFAENYSWYKLRNEGLLAKVASWRQIRPDAAIALELSDDDMEKETSKEVAELKKFTPDHVDDPAIREVLMEEPERRLDALSELDAAEWLIRSLDRVRQMFVMTEDEELLEEFGSIELLVGLMAAIRRSDMEGQSQILDKFARKNLDSLGIPIIMCLDGPNGPDRSTEAADRGLVPSTVEDRFTQYLHGNDPELTFPIYLLIRWCAPKPDFAGWQRVLLDRLRELARDNAADRNVEYRWRQAELFYSPPLAP